VRGERWDIHRTRVSDRPAPQAGAWLFGADAGLYAACGGGGVLQLLSVQSARGPVDLPRLSRALDSRPAPLG
jgi:hypothetical protein